MDSKDKSEYPKAVIYTKTTPIGAIPWTPGMDIAGVSVSPADGRLGSPKTGDMIAFDPEKPSDQWLIAGAYFRANYKQKKAVALSRPRPTSEQLAQHFHEAYEELAPEHGYKTRTASAKPWSDVPQKNKDLMIATCQRLLDTLWSRLA